MLSVEFIILLSALVPGLGHIYLGKIRKGVIIILITIAAVSAWLFVPRFVPYPFGWIILAAYWIWQIVDARRLYYKYKPEGNDRI